MTATSLFLIANNLLTKNFSPGELITKENGKDFPECQKAYEEFRTGMEKGELWAWKMFDSSTKIPSGLLTGSIADFGNYDECLSVRTDGFAGQHCMATIGINSTVLEHLGLEDARLLEVQPALRWSYCVPSTCSAQALQEALTGVLQDLPLLPQVLPSDCHVTDSKPLSSSDILGISICSLLLAMVLSSTIYDVISRHASLARNPWLLAFSLYSNGKKLLNVNSSPDSLECLHGVRFLSIAWVVLGHRYFFASQQALLNLTAIFQIIENVQFQLVAGGILAVDTFFLIGGLLNSYNLLKLMDRTRRFPGVTFYVHRYLRTTPALAAMVLIYATWYVRIGDGPVWELQTAYQKDLCQKYWWSTLLYINNYYNPVEQCAGQSWYLAVDMQLYWLSPLLILPLWKWPRPGKLFLTAVLLLSVLSQFLVAYFYEIRMPFTISQNLEEYKKVTKLIYVPTHTRATPYVVGIAFGYYLNHLRKQQRRPKFSKLLVICGWILSTALCLSVILGNYPFFRSEANHPYDRLESSFYIGLHRLAWSLGLVWIILACLFGYGGIINSILSWKAFIPLGRLSYCIFLCHLAIQGYDLASVRTVNFYADYSMIHKFFGDICVAVIFSAVMSLIFESPIVVLEKLIFRTRETKKKEKEEEEEEEVVVSVKEVSEGEVNSGFEELDETGKVSAIGSAS